MPPTIRVVVPTRMSGTGRAGSADASQMIPPRQVSRAAPRIARTTFVVLVEFRVELRAGFRVELLGVLLVVVMAPPGVSARLPGRSALGRRRIHRGGSEVVRQPPRVR